MWWSQSSFYQHKHLFGTQCFTSVMRLTDVSRRVSYCWANCDPAGRCWISTHHFCHPANWQHLSLKELPAVSRETPAGQECEDWRTPLSLRYSVRASVWLHSQGCLTNNSVKHVAQKVAGKKTQLPLGSQRWYGTEGPQLMCGSHKAVQNRTMWPGVLKVLIFAPLCVSLVQAAEIIRFYSFPSLLINHHVICSDVLFVIKKKKSNTHSHTCVAITSEGLTTDGL